MVYKPQTNNGNSSNIGDSENGSATIPALSDAELAGLKRQELIELIQRCCPDKARVLLMTEEEQAKAIIDMLAITALTSIDRKEARECGKEWMDRKQGKPVMRNKHELAISDDTLAAMKELRQLPKEALQAIQGIIMDAEYEEVGEE